MQLPLHPRQGEAFLSSATEILYGGAAGGGKSHLFRVASIAWCHAIPGLQVYIFRRTYPDLLANHMQGPSGFPVLLGPWVDSKYVKIIYGNTPVVRFGNGSRIHLRHCQHERDVYHYQGAEIHVLIIDELTQWQGPMYRFLRSRVRLTGVDVPEQYQGQFPRILAGSNPGGVGHTWVKQGFVDMAPPMTVTQMPPDEGGMLRQFVPAKLEDNPSLMAADPNYEQRLEGLGSPELVRAMREGDWDIVAGGMFDDVWDRKVHVVEPFDVPLGWRIDRSFDWGSSKPFSVGWWAESDGTECVINGKVVCLPPKSLVRIGEWYGWNGKANEGSKMSDTEIAKGIKEREERMGISDRVVPGPADNSIHSDTGVESPAQQQAREGVIWEPSDKSPGSRIRGWQVIRDRLAAALPMADGLPLEEPVMLVTSDCVHWIRTVPVLPRDDKRLEDVDTDAEDHAGDETRYRCSGYAPLYTHYSKHSAGWTPNGPN